jgi:tetratricopeptide (TPR) repeat protein
MSNTPSNPAASANALNLSKPSLTQSSASTGLRHLAGKKNANKLKDEEIKAIFIARQPVLASIMEDVRNTQLGDAPQHHLIIGLRGMGKTTLLRRIEAELRTEEYVHRFIPLAFPEEHYARVRLDCLSEFWLNCLDSLANTRQHEGLEDEAKRLDVIIRDFMRSKLPETELATECKKVLDAELLNTGRRPVLLLDNFVKLMGRLPNHDWALRSWLQASDAPLLIAANVEQPSDLSDYSAAFYDSMKTHWIGRLDVEEVMQVMRTLVEQENRPRDMLNQLNQSRPRLAALHALTGGNPRTVIYLYQLLVGGLSEHIEQDLKRLMDDIDALYEVRLNNLADQAYEVFAALALAWRPQSAAQLKLATGLQQGGVSGQLARLEDTGLVEKVPLYNSKKTGYQVTERLFNIWYLERIGSRRDAAPVESLAAFLEAFYSYESVRRMTEFLIQKTQWETNDVALANVYLLYTNKINPGKELFENLSHRTQTETARLLIRKNESILAILKNGGVKPTKNIVRFANLENMLLKNVPSGSKVNPTDFATAVMGSISMLQSGGKGDGQSIANSGVLSAIQIRELMAVFEDEISQFNDHLGKDNVKWFREILLKGELTSNNNISEWENLIQKVTKIGYLNILLELIPRNFIHLYAKGLDKKLILQGPSSELLEQLGDAYQFEGGKDTAALEKYKEALETTENKDRVNHKIGILFSLKLKDYESALFYLKNAISMNNKDARYWNDLADTYRKIRNFNKSEEAYSAAIQLESESPYYLKNLGVLYLEDMKKYEEAENCFKRAIELDSKYNLAREYLTELYIKEKKYEYAISCLQDSKKNVAFKSLKNEVAYWNKIGNIYRDYLDKNSDAKIAYKEAINLDSNDICAPYNLIFLLRDSSVDLSESKSLFDRYSKPNHFADTFYIHHALFAIYEDNWGDARKYFISAFEHAEYTLPPETRDDWFRACAVMMHIGGAPAIEKLLGWIAELDATARLLPLVEALQAIAIGSRDVLMNSPAEVRPVASSIYDEIELRRVRLPATSAWKAK